MIRRLVLAMLKDVRRRGSCYVMTLPRLEDGLIVGGGKWIGVPTEAGVGLIYTNCCGLLQSRIVLPLS